MDPVRINVQRVFDFGTVVSIVGVDADSGASVVVHVDHRPFQSLLDDWRNEGFPQPIIFGANNLTLSLNLDPDAQG
jgi:hypothetical protein